MEQHLFREILDHATSQQLRELLDDNSDLSEEQVLALKAQLQMLEDLKRMSRPGNIDFVSSTDPDQKRLREKKAKSAFTKTILFILAVGIIVALVLYSNHRSASMPKNYSEYSASAEATILTVKAQKMPSQGFDGMTEITLHYVVHYSYEIGNRTYKETVQLKPVSGNAAKIGRLKEAIGQHDFPIKYKPSNPQESILDIYE